MSAFPVHVSEYHVAAWGLWGSEQGSGELELEFQMIVRHHMAAGN